MNEPKLTVTGRDLAVSESTRRRNPGLYGHSPSGIPAVNPEPVERVALDRPIPREAKGGNRATIRFTVFSRRPADWDAYVFKELQDLLIKSGCLPDDDWSSLKGEVVSEKVQTVEEERTLIEIFR